MIALVETVGTKVKMSLFETIKEVEKELIFRYNKRVKEVKQIDWRNSWIDLKRKYGKVDSWNEVIEWRLVSVGD